MSGSFIPPDAPPPPYPATMEVKIKGKLEQVAYDYREINLRHLPWMPLNLNRLFGSVFYTRRDYQGFFTGLTLWGRSWHQVPAGSLPSDERELATIAGVGDLRNWRKVSRAALHGFVLCNDGRYYHPVICDYALVAFAKTWGSRRAANARWKNSLPSPDDGGGSEAPPSGEDASDSHGSERERTANTRKSRAKSRTNLHTIHREPDPSNSEQPIENTGNASCERIAPAYADAMLRTGTRTIESKKESKHDTASPEPPVDKRPKTERGTRLPGDWQPSEHDVAHARAQGFSDAQIATLAAAFRDYWIAQPGSKGLKLDWSATWRNWLTREDPRRVKSLPETSQKTNGAVSGIAPVSDLTWELRLNGYRKNKFWPENAYHSAPPTSPNCAAPRHLLVKHGFRKEPESFSLIPTTSKD